MPSLSSFVDQADRTRTTHLARGAAGLTRTLGSLVRLVAILAAVLIPVAARAQSDPVVEPTMRDLAARHYMMHGDYQAVLVSSSPVTWGGWPNNALGETAPDLVPDGFYGSLVDSGGNLTSYGAGVMNALQAAYEGLKLDSIGKYVQPSTIGTSSSPTTLGSGDFTSFAAADTSTTGATASGRVATIGSHAQQVSAFIGTVSWTNSGVHGIDRYVQSAQINCCSGTQADCLCAAIASASSMSWTYEVSAAGNVPAYGMNSLTPFWGSCVGGGPAVSVFLGQGVFPGVAQVGWTGCPGCSGRSYLDLYLKVTNKIAGTGPFFDALGANPPVSGAAYPTEPNFELFGSRRDSSFDGKYVVGVWPGGMSIPSPCGTTQGWVVKNSAVIVRPDFRVGQSHGGLQPSGGVPAIRPDDAAGLLGEGDLGGNPGQTPQGCAPVNLTSGFKSESATDLVVAATGSPFKLEREYTSEYAYESNASGNLLGRGWMATPFRSIKVTGTGTSRVVTLFGPPMQRHLVFTNHDPVNAPEVWSAGGPGTETLVRTYLLVDDTYWPVWRLIEPGGWSINFYRAKDWDDPSISNPPTAVVGMVLQERDPYGNPRTYVYQTPNPSDTQALRARLSAIYINGTPKGAATEAEVVFTWIYQSGSLNGKLDKVEVHRRVGQTNNFMTTQIVDYTYAAEGSGWSSSIGSGADLVQVTTKERVDEVPADSPAPDPYRVRITQYRYHNGSAVASSGTDERLLIDGAAGQLKAVIMPEQIEWYALQRAPVASGWTAADALTQAAAELLAKADSDALASPVSSMIALDFASKIIDYENATGGRVNTEFLQTTCGCSSASSQGLKQHYVYSGTYTAGSSNQGSTTRLEESLGLNTSPGVYDSSPYRVTFYDMEMLGSSGSAVSYLVNKAVRDPALSITWAWHSEYDSDHNLSRSIMPDGAASYAAYGESTSGVPEYTAASTGLSYSYSYVNNRISETRRGTPGATGALISKVFYDSTGSVPPHLPTKIERYRVASSPGSDDTEVTTYSYGFYSDTAAPITAAKLYPLAWVKTSVEAELQAENGPNSATTYDTYELYDNRGRNFWSRAADGSLTYRAFDDVSGGVTATVLNASPSAPAGDAGAAIPSSIASLSTAGWGRTGSGADATVLPGGELVTSCSYDRLGRLIRSVATPGAVASHSGSVAGASTYIVRGLRKLPGRTAGPYVYAETTLPHRLAGSGVAYSGPAAIAYQSAGGNSLAQITQGVDTSVSTYDPLASPPSYTLASTILSRSQRTYFASGQIDSERVWYAVNQSDLSDTVYSYVKSWTYDAAGRSAQVTDFDGTVTRTEYDVLDRPIRTYIGASSATLVQTAELYYDTQSASHSAIGNGRLGLERRFVGPSSGEPLAPSYYRDTKRSYDSVGRLAMVAPPTPPYHLYDYDLQDRVVGEAESDGTLGEPSGYSSLSTDRRALKTTAYSQRGLVYRSQLALNPESGSPSFLSSYTWFDAAGRPIEEWGPNAPAVKRSYDGLGRVAAIYTTDRAGDAAPGASGNAADAASLSGDTVLAQSLPYYGGSGSRQEGRLLMDRSYARLHGSTATGVLGYSDAVVTYAGHMYDDADREVCSVDFGTHRSDAELSSGSAGDQPSWPPSSVPGATWTDPNCSTCQPPAVTGRSFDDRGLVASETDALGRVRRYAYDDLGRRGVTIENSVSIGTSAVAWNATGGNWSITGLSNSAAADQDRVTAVLYDGGGRVTQQIAYNVTGASSPSTPYAQTTTYIYGSSVGSASTSTDSLVAGYHLLAEVRYPGETDGSPQPTDNAYKVRYSYNRQGELRSITDQNGTVHVMRRDAAGRLASDTVESINTSLLDNTVKRIGYTYDGMGRRSKVTSYDQISPSDTVLNEVQFSYTSMGQIARMYQNPDGAVSFDSSGNPSSGGTQVTTYGYTGTSTAASNNYSRLETLTYPGGTAVNHLYNPTGSSSSVSSTISRLVRTEINGSTPIPLVEYTFLGLGTVVAADYASPAFKLDLITGPNGAASTGHYSGLDHRGRLRRQLWVDHGFGAGTGGLPNRPPIFSERYDYDRLNRIRRADDRPGAGWTDRDAGWDYDGLNRVSVERRGVYSSPGSSWTFASGEPQPSRAFGYDSLGNWLTSTLDSNCDGTFASGEQESRTHNQGNELLGRSIPGASTTSVTDSYDDAGNLRTCATTIGGSTTTLTYTHDAWNRLAAWNAGGTDTTIRYYGLHQRAKVSDPSGGQTRQFYDASWRVLESRTRPASNGDDAFDEYFWGARHIDDLVARRIDTTTLGDHSDDTIYFAVTDAQFNVRALLKPSGSSAAAVLVERVDYDATGTTRHHRVGDVDGDGDYDSTDNSTLTSLASTAIGASGYLAAADLDRSGTIDSTDVTLAGGTTYQAALAAGKVSALPRVATGYGGYVYDSDLGLYLARNRWYDPSAGRWIQRDPAGYVNGFSLYQYCEGQPWQCSDPMGLWGWDHDWLETIVDLVLPTEQGDAARSGFAQGARDGALIQLNEYTFHQFSGLDCESQRLIRENGDLYQASAWAGKVSREAAIFAATAGLGEIANGVRGTGAIADGLRALSEFESIASAARYANNAMATYQIGTGLYNVAAGGYQIGQGNYAAGAGMVALGALGALGGKASFAGSPVGRAGSEGTMLYRGLAKGEAEGLSRGLSARTPGLRNDVVSHVAGAKQTGWISTTKSLKVAEKYGEHGIVAIDPNKVTNHIADISNGIPGLGRNHMLSNWARKAQEVLIRDHIPADAITVISGPK